MGEIGALRGIGGHDGADPLGLDDACTIIEVRRQLLEIDDAYVPSDEEVAAAAGTTVAAARRVLALAAPAGRPAVSCRPFG